MIAQMILSSNLKLSNIFKVFKANMKIIYICFYLAVFPTCFSISNLLPDTFMLSESLSDLGQCTVTLLMSKLDIDIDSSTDTFYEVEPLKVSSGFCIDRFFKLLQKTFCLE